MRLIINDQFEVIEYTGDSPIFQGETPDHKHSFSIHLLKDDVKYSILNQISQLELKLNTENPISLKGVGIIKVEKQKQKDNEKTYSVNILSETEVSNLKNESYRISDEQNRTTSLLSTNLQFERFFDKIEKVNLELDKRNQINSELLSLNKQLLLKDELLERNKNNVEALLNNNLQAFILVDTFYSIQAFNTKAKALFQTISQKEIEKNAFFYDYFYDNDLKSVKKDIKKISQNENTQFTVTRNYFDQTHQKTKTFRVNYTAVLDKEHKLRSISIGFVDITDLVDTQKELAASQNLIASVFNTTSIGIIIINENGDIVDVNSSVCNHLEMPILRLKDHNIHYLFKESKFTKDFPFFIAENSDQIIQWNSENSKETKFFNVRAEILDSIEGNKLIVLTLMDITNELLTKQRLKNITDNIPGTVFRYLLKDSGEDRLLYVSERSMELWGYKNQELLENNELIWNNYHPEDIQIHRDSILASKSSLTDWYHEWRYFHPDKGLRWHRGIGKPSKLSNGDVVWNSIIFDITDEKTIEKESQVLKDEIENILVQSPDIICTINKDWEFEKVSSASFNILGYFADELIGERFIDFVADRSAEETINMFQDLLNGNSTRNFENYCHHKNGSIVPLIWSARWDDSNELLYCIARDGSEKKKQERAIQMMNERYKLATLATNEIIWESDVSKNTLFFSDNFKKLFAFELPGTLKNIDFYKGLIHKSMRDRVAKSMKDALLNKSTSKWEEKYEIRNADDSYITVVDSAIIIRDDKGKAQKMVGAIKDISELEKANQMESFEKVILSKSLKPETTLLSLSESFAQGIELVISKSKCSILSVVENKLYNLASPSIPVELINKLNGVEIGPMQASCGTSAFTNKIVIVKEIYKDEKWKDFQFVATDFNLKSCWSVPVQNSLGQVVSTIGIYKDHIYTPQKWEVKLIKRFANLLGILIQKYQNEEKIRKSNEVYELVNKASRDAIYELDLINNNLKWGESYTNIFGYQVDSKEKFPLENLYENIHPDDQQETKNSWEDFLNSSKIKWSFSYRYLKNNNTYSDVLENGYLIRNDKNEPVRMIGVLRDITEQKKLESLYIRSSKLAKIGSWEVDLKNENVYWSQITREIHEVDNAFIPDFDNALTHFFSEYYQTKISDAFSEAVEKNKTIDVEVQLTTANNTTKWVRLTGETELLQNKVVKVFGSIQDIEIRKRAELELIEKTKFLTLLSNINKELLDYEKWDESIIKIFKIVGESIDIDRVYFFKIFCKEGVEKLKQIFEWCSKNTFPQINDPRLQALPTSEIPSIRSSIHNNEPFQVITSSLKDGPEKKLFEESGIKSIYNTPVHFKQQLFGLFGFDDCTKERVWNDQEIFFLSTVAQNISIAYEGYIAELKIKKEKKAKESILASIKDGFLSIDKNWIINYWNAEAQKITGIERDSALGKSLWEVFPEINDLSIKNQLKIAVDNRTTRIFESKFPGLNKWLELNIYPSKKGSSIYFKNVTDRKLKEEELILSNQRFEKVTEATNDAIWEWDIESNLLYWGAGYTKQFGHRVKNQSQNLKMWENLVHPNDREAIKSSLSKSIDNPEKVSWTEEYRYLNVDETYSFVMDRGCIIRNKEGKATRIIGALTDISHRKEYEESLEYLNSVLKNRADELTQKNQELERFAYIASHDLQEPLRMVTGFLSQLEKKYSEKLDDKAKQYIFYAVDGAKRMRNIILDLLEYSKLGKMDENQIALIDLNEVIDEVTTTLRRLEESNAQINVAKLPNVFGYKLSFTQTFQNLISNALKYRYEDRKTIINIDYKENDTHYIFSVEDNGIGIDPKFHEKVFVIFQRLHNKDSFSGTGVGLAIVKKVIEQMGGEIWIESDTNQGTTFYFSIPKKSTSNEEEE